MELSQFRNAVEEADFSKESLDNLLGIIDAVLARDGKLTNSEITEIDEIIATEIEYADNHVKYHEKMAGKLERSIKIFSLKIKLIGLSKSMFSLVLSALRRKG